MSVMKRDVAVEPAMPGTSPVGDGESPRRRPWRGKFRDAFRGIKRGIRGHSSFAVHFFFGAVALAAAASLGASPAEWCFIILCIMVVLTAELFNSAVESLVRLLSPDQAEEAGRALDISAGAVLLSSIGAAIIGLLIFVPKVLELVRR
jgi:diacylglycerol kinase